MKANRDKGAHPAGGVGEVILLEDCTEVTRQNIEGYLAHKWGRTGGLPSDHPHKATPPLEG